MPKTLTNSDFLGGRGGGVKERFLSDVAPEQA